MKKPALAILVTFSLAWLPSAEAQLFSRKPKAPPAQAPTPEQRVGELIVQAKTDKDDRKRAAAAAELRDVDAKLFAEVVPLLVDVARSDPQANVRGEALASLAKIRPVSQSAGQTLEWAAGHDESWKVRMQAKTALMRYQWAGYHADKGDPKEPQAPMTTEPPLHDPRGAAVKAARPPAPSTAVRPPTKTVASPVNAPKKSPTSVPVIVTTPAPAIVTTPAPAIVTAPGPLAAPPVPQAVPSVPQPKPLPSLPPVIVTQPAPPIAAPPIVAAPTAAPPLIGTNPAPAPLPPIVLPPLPETTLAPLPKVAIPPASIVTPPVDAAEPNFRPARQNPPRFNTAVPQTPTTTPPPAPAANEKGGPVLRPPM